MFALWVGDYITRSRASASMAIFYIWFELFFFPPENKIKALNHLFGEK